MSGFHPTIVLVDTRPLDLFIRNCLHSSHEICLLS